MNLRTFLLTASLAALAAHASRAEDRLRWNEPVVCLQTPDGEALRAQCPELGKTPNASKVCLVTPMCRSGKPGADCHEYERVQGCGHPPDGDRAGYDALVAQGFTFQKATAEAPPGWDRDAEGRVFQVTFDLNRRVWLGARYAPSISGDGADAGRLGLEFGVRTDVLEDDLRTRLRVSILPTELLLNPLEINAALLHVDQYRDNGEPLFRVTTFWGEPARHDAYANIGWWLELMGVNYRPRGSDKDLLIRFAAFAPTLELWHDADLASYVRLRVGAAFDDLYLLPGDGWHRLAVSPFAALEADVTLDDAGFHHLTASTGYEAPIWWPEEGGTVYQTRFQSELAYEVILLAINDQPITFRASVSGGYRDDLDGGPNGWEVTAGAGLRVSLWAPPRDPDVLEAARAQKAE